MSEVSDGSRGLVIEADLLDRPNFRPEIAGFSCDKKLVYLLSATHAKQQVNDMALARDKDGR